MTEYFAIPINLQISLGIGYLAYVTAWAGRRLHHGPLDTLLISVAFSLPVLLLQAVATQALPQPMAALVAAGAGLLLSLAAAMAWRHRGRARWLAFMGWTGTHAEDGDATTWQALLQTPDLRVSQISVHTSDGRVLYLNDHAKYADAPQGGLLLGTDGSVLMVVEEEELPGGTTEVRQGIADPAGGTRMTYVPAASITRVNIRYL